jgi:uncharacterized protein DUF6894
VIVAYGISRIHSSRETGVNHGTMVGKNMGPFYFGLTDGQRVLGGRDATELAGLAQVQDEAIAFGSAVLKHRHAFGIDDIASWSVRVTNGIGRVLAVVPLSEVKRLQARGGKRRAA